MVTHNLKVLAGIRAHVVINKARQGEQLQPQARVMQALREAIDAKRGELEALILAGKFGTEAYDQAKTQIAIWTAAWDSNR